MKLTHALLLAASLAPSAAAQNEAVTLRISQAVQTPSVEPTVRVYLDVLDRNERVSDAPASGHLSATLGGDVLELVETRRLSDTSEGIAYIFLVDTSRSLSRTEFDHILDALDSWLARLSRRDRVAVLSFGDESRQLVDFTNDYTAVQAALYTLGPTDNLTVLHRALDDGLSLARRRDPDLPGRRVMVVLTDGRDEGSGLSAEDILDSLRLDPIPIYAIGLSRLRDLAQRERYLGLLHRFASNSGGAYVAGQSDDLGDAYATMHQAARRVWVADFACPGCVVDGSSRRLQVNLTEDGRVLSDGREFRLLPSLGELPADRPAEVAEPVVEPTTPPQAAVEAATEPETADVDGNGSEESRRLSLWPLVLVALAALAAFGFWLWRRHSSQESETNLNAPPKYETQTGIPTTRPPHPVALRLVRLIVVRGNHTGREYSLTLMEKAVIGTRSTCDSVIVDEPGVEPEQFEIYQFDNKVYIRDRSEKRPTLVDGLAIEKRHLLKNQALVGTAEFIVRVLYDDPRPVTL